MEVDDEIRELVMVGASAVEMKKKAIERGMITLAAAASRFARHDPLEEVAAKPFTEF